MAIEGKEKSERRVVMAPKGMEFLLRREKLVSKTAERSSKANTEMCPLKLTI